MEESGDLSAKLIALAVVSIVTRHATWVFTHQPLCRMGSTAKPSVLGFFMLPGTPSITVIHLFQGFSNLFKQKVGKMFPQSSRFAVCGSQLEQSHSDCLGHGHPRTLFIFKVSCK